jgi:hypothetical protein
LGERVVRNDEVSGSIPLGSTSRNPIGPAIALDPSRSKAARDIAALNR